MVDDSGVVPLSLPHHWCCWKQAQDAMENLPPPLVFTPPIWLED